MTTETKEPTPAPRRIVRRRRQRAGGANALPELDVALVQKVVTESGLPAAYSFETPKTIRRIVELRAQHVALQMPEGLLLYATVLADVLKRLSQLLHAKVLAGTTTEASESNSSTVENKKGDAVPAIVCQQVSVLGDVTYGACCIGDLDAQALGADLLVHYGHSCLVPLQHTVLPCLYVFVEIQFDVQHMVESLHATLNANRSNLERLTDEEDKEEKAVVVYLLGTVQFRHALGYAKTLLEEKASTEELLLSYRVHIPQVKPLSPGEVLGCTSPKLDQHDKENERAICCFVADGRFHLESTLISNAHAGIADYYRYDPYGKSLTTESYGHDEMKSLRYQSIQHARQVLATGTTPTTVGIMLGTLGRQGNPAIVQRIREALQKYNQAKGTSDCRAFVMLVSEITPAKLALMESKVHLWVQVACPRLSVDWGHLLSSTRPVLSSYELFVALDETAWLDDNSSYPMDYYSQSGGPWSNYHPDNKAREMMTVGGSAVV